MNIVLLGATGFVGSALLEEALARGHKVTAIVRRPEKLATRTGLIAKAGDVEDAESLTNLIRGHDALISAFNPGWSDPNLYDDQVRGTASIIRAVKTAGIKRVLWVGGAGGLEVLPGTRLVDTPNFPEKVKPGSLATINALEQLRREPEIDWSYLAPSANLKTGLRTGKFRVGGDQLEPHFGRGLRGGDDRRARASGSHPSTLYRWLLVGSLHVRRRLYRYGLSTTLI